MTTDKQTVQAQATVPLPSADLIIYRFDQTDRSLHDLDKKIDKFTNNFATKKELVAVDDRLKTVERNIGKVVWLVVSSVILALLALVFGRLFNR